jgi:hypothetical protein
MMNAIENCDGVSHLTNAIPHLGSTDWSMNDKSRKLGTQNLIDASVKHGANCNS